MALGVMAVMTRGTSGICTGIRQMSVGVVAVMTKEISGIHMTRTDGSRGQG